jgi:tRNA U54 and U55 pseudouridine synthase Pus10
MSHKKAKLLRKLQNESRIELFKSLISRVDDDDFNEDHLQEGDSCPICQSKLDLVDFTAAGYAHFLADISVHNHVRGKPD